MIKTRSFKFLALIIGIFLIEILAPGVVIADSAVTFPDANLESAIREAIKKPSGDINLAEVQAITELDAGEKGIRSIEGIQYLSNLQVLYLNDNDISDISLLKGLTKLQTLGLCNNKVVDISALSGLSELDFLSLYNNKVQDIAALEGLKKLRTLKLDKDPIADYSPIYEIYGNLVEKDFNIVINNSGGVMVTVNGQPLPFDVPPVEENDTMIVPMRTIFEALGADVRWDGSTETITATKGPITITLQIGKKTATVDGNTINLAVPAKIISERTFVPLRFIAEALGCEVNWAAETKAISIIDHTPLIYTKKVEYEPDYCVNYYINGKLVAFNSLGSNGTPSSQWINGIGWTLWVGFQGTSIRTEPRELKISGGGSYDPNSKDWRKDPQVVSHNLAPAIDFVLQDIREHNSRVR